jgi:hypothetical protein
MKKSRLLQRVVGFELTAFLGMIAIIWADELFDLPHRIIGAPVTATNWAEGVMETTLLVLLAAVVLTFSWFSLRRIRYLEGFLHLCSFCKRVEVNGEWVPIEKILDTRSEAVLRHGLCPDCVEEHYGDFFKEETAKADRHGPHASGLAQSQ